MHLSDKDILLNFLSNQKLAVISTNSSSKSSPESALVAFVEDSDLYLYFQTKSSTRKAVNLSSNPNVSFVIGLTLEDLATVQYEGIATQLVTLEDLDACKQLFSRKNSPSSEKHFDNPATIFYKVSPTWIGYSDYSGKMPLIIELSDFK